MPVLLAATALAPTVASAQSSGTCTAKVSATQAPETAAFSIDCGANTISSVEVRSSESGRIQENTGTACSPDGENQTFTCQPTSSASAGLLTGRFNAADSDVCNDPRLDLTFSVQTNAGAREVGPTAVSGCSDTGTSPSGDRDCDDFGGSQERAQEFFEQEGGPDEDPHRLDDDNDGEACEDLSAPGGGVDTGGGGTASAQTLGPLPFVLGGGALGLLVAGVVKPPRSRRHA